MPTSIAMFILACVLSSLPAQRVLWHRAGVAKTYQVTGASAFIGDANGDGYDELVAAVNEPQPGWTDLIVLSGKNGKILRAVVRPKGYSYWGPVSTGDLNGGGIGDYAAHATPTRWPWAINLVDVRSGEDDKLLWRVSGPNGDAFGSVVLGNLDVKGDGQPDLLVSAYLRKPRKVYVFNHLGKAIRS